MASPSTKAPAQDNMDPGTLKDFENMSIEQPGDEIFYHLACIEDERKMIEFHGTYEEIKEFDEIIVDLFRELEHILGKLNKSKRSYRFRAKL